MACCKFLATDSTTFQLLHLVFTVCLTLCYKLRTRCQNKLHEGKNFCCLQYLDECWHIAVIQIIVEWMRTHMILVLRVLLRTPAWGPQNSAKTRVARAYQTFLAFWVYSLHTKSADEETEDAWFCLPEMILNGRLEPGSMARSSPFLLYRTMPPLVLCLLKVVRRFQNLKQEVSVQLGEVGLSDLNIGNILVSKTKL